MICEKSEASGRTGKPAPPSRQPGPAQGPAPEPEPELKIDLERLVWDPEYREQMRRRLKRPG